MAIGVGVASKLVMWFPPRVVVIAGGILIVGAMLYGSTLNRGMPYFPNLVVPLFIGAVGLGAVSVPLGLSLIASVGFDRIGPASAISVMLQTLGGPLVLVIIQVAITSRTLSLGGTIGPVKSLNAAQLNALDHGYTYGLLWLAGVVILLGAVALRIGYTAQQVARAQEVNDACANFRSSLTSPAANRLRRLAAADSHRNPDRTLWKPRTDPVGLQYGLQRFHFD